MRVAKPGPARSPDLTSKPPEHAVAEDRKEPPFEGGSQPVPHQKDPVPGPGRSVAQVVTLILCVLVVAAAAVWIFSHV
jgi:hypothetical protein